MRNAGQLWLPGRGPVAIYVKRQLVPFGEFIPFREPALHDHLAAVAAAGQLHRRATGRWCSAIGKIRLGDVICYEVGFDSLVSSEVSAGANLLAMQTNDADFELDGQTGETLQQLAMARIRAIEFDRAVVVASTTGISAIIAPDGALLASSQHLAAGRARGPGAAAEQRSRWPTGSATGRRSYSSRWPVAPWPGLSALGTAGAGPAR